MGSGQLQHQRARRLRSDQLTPMSGLRGNTHAHRLAAFCFCLGAVFIPLAQPQAQVTGDEAEMNRLHVKAEEAIGNDDPEGAAMNIGRAALMAKQLGRLNASDPTAVRLYRGAEALFRAQEHSYRAMALFRRAGGQLPASSGVCGSLALSQASLEHALSDLAETAPPPAALAEQAKDWRDTADDWTAVVASMLTDYQCR